MLHYGLRAMVRGVLLKEFFTMKKVRCPGCKSSNVHDAVESGQVVMCARPATPFHMPRGTNACGATYRIPKRGAFGIPTARRVMNRFGKMAAVG